MALVQEEFFFFHTARAPFFFGFTQLARLFFSHTASAPCFIFFGFESTQLSRQVQQKRTQMEMRRQLRQECTQVEVQ